MIPHYTPNQTTISQHLYYLQNLDGTLIHLTCAPIDPNFFKTSDLNDAYSILYTWMDSSAKDILYFMGMLCDPSNNYGFSLLKMITDLNNGDAARIRSIVQNEESIHQNRDWSYTFTEIIKHKMDNLNAKRTICLLHAAFIFPQKAAWYKANIDYIAQILQEGVQERKAQLQKKPNKSIIERDSKQSNEHNPQPFSTSQIANEPAIDKNTIEHLEDTIVTQVAPQEEQETIREQLNQAPCFEELANNTVDSIEVSVPGACLSTKPNPIQLSTNTFTALIIEPEHEEVTESSPVINVQKTKKRKKRKVAAVKPTTDALSEIQKSSRSNLTKLQSVRKKYKDGFFCLDANTDSKNLQNILREGLWEYICLLVPKSSQSDKDQRYFRELSSIFITNYHNNLKLEYKERLYSKLIDIGYNILWGNEILSSGSPNIIGWFHFIENAIKVANETIHPGIWLSIFEPELDEFCNQKPDYAPKKDALKKQLQEIIHKATKPVKPSSSQKKSRLARKGRELQTTFNQKIQVINQEENNQRVNALEIVKRFNDQLEKESKLLLDLLKQGRLTFENITDRIEKKKNSSIEMQLWFILYKNMIAESLDKTLQERCFIQYFLSLEDSIYNMAFVQNMQQHDRLEIRYSSFDYFCQDSERLNHLIDLINSPSEDMRLLVTKKPHVWIIFYTYLTSALIHNNQDQLSDELKTQIDCCSKIILSFFEKLVTYPNEHEIHEIPQYSTLMEFLIWSLSPSLLRTQPDTMIAIAHKALDTALQIKELSGWIDTVKDPAQSQYFTEFLKCFDTVFNSIRNNEWKCRPDNNQRLGELFIKHIREWNNIQPDNLEMFLSFRKEFEFLFAINTDANPVVFTQMVVLLVIQHWIKTQDFDSALQFLLKKDDNGEPFFPNNHHGYIFAFNYLIISMYHAGKQKDAEAIAAYCAVLFYGQPFGYIGDAIFTTLKQLSN